MIGKIQQWNFQRGFGFLQTPKGKDYFAHIRNWREDEPPEIGRSVVFEVAPGIAEKKLHQAINVRFATAKDISDYQDTQLRPDVVALLQGQKGGKAGSQ